MRLTQEKLRSQAGAFLCCCFSISEVTLRRSKREDQDGCKSILARKNAVVTHHSIARRRFSNRRDPKLKTQRVVGSGTWTTWKPAMPPQPSFTWLCNVTVWLAP